MRYFAVAIVLLTGLLFAASGKEIFEQKCSNCHLSYIPQLQLNRNYKNSNKDLNLTAPTLMEISFALKDQVGDRKADEESQKMEIESFLTEYVNMPDLNKSILPENVKKTFKVMPSMKGKLSEDEFEALSEYMYDYVEQKMIHESVKRYSYKEAMQIAKKEKKVILIEGYIPFCRWCIKMDREVMVEQEVKNRLNTHFVLVKMNLLTEKLPLKIKRLGTPSFYFIDSSATEVIDTVEGFGNKGEFLELLGRIVKEEK